MKFTLLFLASFIIVLTLSCLALQIRRDAKAHMPGRAKIQVYCAASVANAVNEIVQSYNRKHAADVEVLRTGGSGELTGQIKLEFETKLSGGADVFVTADDELLKKAHSEGVFSETFCLAEQQPVIAVAASSDLKIDDLKSLLAQVDLRFGICSERAAIGRIVRNIAQENGLLKRLESAKTVDAENVMTLAQSLLTGSLDAAVVWDTSVIQINQEKPLLKVAAFLDPHQKFPGELAIGIVSNTKNRAACLQFVDYLQNSDFSQQVLDEYGYSDKR